MAELTVEKLGGLAGFGGSSHLSSKGTHSFEALGQSDQDAVERLFASPEARAGNPDLRDGFSYRITRDTPTGSESVEVPEALVPAALRSVVRDTLD